MVITNINNVEKFFDAVNRCTDKVELVCDDFRINLKSSITKYVAVAKIFNNCTVSRLEVVAYNQHDRNTLITYMLGDLGNNE